jgi:hypothetical protein
LPLRALNFHTESQTERLRAWITTVTDYSYADPTARDTQTHHKLVKFQSGASADRRSKSYDYGHWHQRIGPIGPSRPSWVGCLLEALALPSRWTSLQNGKVLVERGIVLDFCPRITPPLTKPDAVLTREGEVLIHCYSIHASSRLKPMHLGHQQIGIALERNSDFPRDLT